MKSKTERGPSAEETEDARPAGALLACVSPAASSSRVIREAARLARDLGMPWTALHVQTPHGEGLGRAEGERLREHFELARRLGGEVVTVRGADVAAEISAFASRNDVTRVVIGKDSVSRRTPFRLARDRVRKLMRLRPDLELHVVPGSPGGSPIPRRPAAQQPAPQTLTVANALKTGLILAAATGLGLIWFAWGFTEANIILLFLLAVLLISLFAGRILGLIASVAAVLLFNFSFTEPRGTLLVHDPRYLVTFPVMLAVALITSELTSRLRRAARSSAQRERRTERLYQTTRGLLSATGGRMVVSVGLGYLRALLRRDVLAYIPDETGALQLQRLPPGADGRTDIEHPPEAAVAAWSFEHGRPAGRGTGVFSESDIYYHPLALRERTLGVVGVVCPAGPLPEAERSLLEAVGAQLALAVDRERLARAEQEHRAEIERERLRSDLLRSISHDLRTPLAAIAGASSTLLSGTGSLDADTACDLARGIYDDATWLSRLVENLLSLTRVEGQSLKLNREWEVAEDLVASALERARGREGTHQFRVNLPEQPILVRVDAALIEQVLVNLLDNAIRHTPEGSRIEIRTAETDQGVIFEVVDDGPGLSEMVLRHAFERFFTESTSQTERRGMGLGMAISKSIVEAHGGTIAAGNREEGGAIIRFSLPREVSPPASSAGPRSQG